MKWMLRLVVSFIIISIILLTIDKFLFSFERGRLFAWWFMQNQGLQAEQTVAARIKNEEHKQYANEIASMLENSTPNSFTQSVALEFADEFKEHPKVQTQLIIIAFDHPNTWVRCYWQKSMKTDYQVVITTRNEKGQQSGTKFSAVNEECEAQ